MPKVNVERRNIDVGRRNVNVKVNMSEVDVKAHSLGLLVVSGANPLITCVAEPVNSTRFNSLQLASCISGAPKLQGLKRRVPNQEFRQTNECKEC
jgi:hypothetical protein